jgi:metacaspase-1
VPPGYDETILPVDFQSAGEIIDDDIHRIVVRPLPKGVRLHAIFDSCHSGSVMDLPFSYKVCGASFSVSSAPVLTGASRGALPG